ncbi:glycosyltransferase [Bacillus sp. JJ1533]|uniref:glycosyltransferase n=1 Tax=Bacillus sp. JJ1533 TaxID=3122959 RepID=UPI002FFEFA49
MNDSTRITVIMATYNCAKYLDECFTSILNQTYENFVVKIIDDCSSDDTVSFVEKWAQKDKRIQFLGIHEENKGLTVTLNELLEEVDTELVARMDADDACLPQRFEKQVEFLDAHPNVSIVGTWAEDFDDDGNFIKVRKVPIKHEDIRKMIIKASPMIHPSVMMRTKDVKSIGGYDTRFRVAQDINLWYRFLGAGLTMANIPEIHMKYRVNPNHAKKRSFKHRMLDAKIRIGGTKLIKASLLERITAVSIPLVLGIMPAGITKLILKYSEKIDPRQKIK